MPSRQGSSRHQAQYEHDSKGDEENLGDKNSQSPEKEDQEQEDQQQGDHLLVLLKVGVSRSRAFDNFGGMRVRPVAAIERGEAGQEEEVEHDAEEAHGHQDPTHRGDIDAGRRVVNGKREDRADREQEQAYTKRHFVSSVTGDSSGA